MSTTPAHYAMPGIAGARVIFTLLCMAAIASLLLGTCATKFNNKPAASIRTLLVPPARDGAAHAAVIARFEQLGLSSQVQSAPGGVLNIVIRKYGSASDRAVRPALLITAGGIHAQAIAGALREAAPLASDLIVLFADGQGGSDAFARYHPWARDAGVVLRFDGGGRKLLLTHLRGASTGQLQDWMTATSASLGSSALHALSAPRTDPLAAIGDISLTFAGAASPGNPDAAPAILALLRHFADPLHDGASHAPSVHFWLPLAGQVEYGDDYIGSISRVTALALLLACCVAWRHAGMRLPQLAAAAVSHALLASLLVAASLVSPHHIIMSAAGTVLFLALNWLLLARAGAHATVLGTLLLPLGALAAATIAMPEVSYLFAWPLLAALLAYAGAQLPVPRHVRAGVMAAAALVPLALFLPLLTQLATANSPAFMLAVTPLLGFAGALVAALKLGMDPQAGLPWAD